MNLWNHAVVEIEIINRICGGVPTDPQLIAAWIGANMPALAKAEQEKLAAATVEQLGAATEEKAEAMWTTFKKDDQGVYIEGRQVKSMLKESANVLRELLIQDERAANGKDVKKSRYTAIKAKLAERLFVEDERVRPLRAGSPIAKPDGCEEKAIHVMTAMGPRNALKRVDYVEAPAMLRFNLRWLADGVCDLDLIRTLLEHASCNGLGADRSQGNGTFRVVSVTETPEASHGLGK